MPASSASGARRRAVRAAKVLPMLAAAPGPSGTFGRGTKESKTVHIAHDVFATRGGNDSSNEEIIVRGDFNRAAGVAALDRVAQRFMKVDEHGVEHSDISASEPSDGHGNFLYTPNYVSSPEVTAGGMTLYVDCKGYIEPAMRERFLDILRDELAPLGQVFVENFKPPAPSTPTATRPAVPLLPRNTATVFPPFPTGFAACELVTTEDVTGELGPVRRTVNASDRCSYSTPDGHNTLDLQLVRDEAAAGTLKFEQLVHTAYDPAERSREGLFLQLVTISGIRDLGDAAFWMTGQVREPFAYGSRIAWSQGGGWVQITLAVDKEHTTGESVRWPLVLARKLSQTLGRN